MNIDACEIEIQVKEGEATLSGTLRSRNWKRWAGDLAEQVSGVKDAHKLHPSRRRTGVATEKSDAKLIVP